MNAVFLRSIVFASGAFVVLLIADALQISAAPLPVAQDQLSRMLLSHGEFHVGVLVLSALGASVGFVVLCEHLPSIKQSAVLGFLFAVLSLVGAAGSLFLAGVPGVIAWLFMGSMACAIGGRLFKKPWHSG